MEYKFTKGYSYAVRVDERLLTALDRVGGVVLNNYTKKIIAENNITNVDIEHGAPADLDDFERTYQIRSALKEIEANVPKYACEFSSGTSLQSNNLEDIIDSLQTEPSDIEKVEATYGSYNGCRFTYRFDCNRANSVWISIDGSRSEVNDVRVQVENALRTSHPELRFFYHPAVPTAVGFLLVIGWIYVGVKIVLPVTNSSMLNGGFKAVSVGVLLAIIVIISAAMSAWYAKMVPQVSFAFSNRYRQRTSVVTFSVWLIAAFVIPVLLAVLGLT